MMEGEESKKRWSNRAVNAITCLCMAYICTHHSEISNGITNRRHQSTKVPVDSHAHVLVPSQHLQAKVASPMSADHEFIVPIVYPNDTWIYRAVFSMLAPYHNLTKIPAVDRHAMRLNSCNHKYCVVNINNMRASSCQVTNGRYLRLLNDALKFIIQQGHRVNDQTLILTSGDDEPLYPKTPETLADPPPMVISQANNGEFLDVLFPTVVRQKFVGSKWAATFQQLVKTAKQTPFSKRNDTVVWRGSPGQAGGCGDLGKYYHPDRNFPHNNCCKGYQAMADSDRMLHPRARLVNHSKHHPSYHDSEYTSTGGALHFLSFKFVITVGNNGFADRVATLLANGNVVLMVSDRYQEWFYPALIPFVHFIPIRFDLSDLNEKIRILKSAPEAALTISKNAIAFIEHGLTLNTRDVYVAEILKQWGEISAKLT
eukprot:m.92711 g.92711  ORF g.92711 m.92711 type:complete len:428 (-) comp26563_c0_seq2:78-1361(-)